MPATLAEGYRTVTTDDLAQLKAERIRALELDHARTVLLCREVVGTADEEGPFRQLAELDRRIAVHLAPPEDAPEDAPEAPVGPPLEVVEDNPDDPEASNEKVTTATGGD